VTAHAAEQAPKRPVKLLWTGGWDSTYRLLELVLLERRAVQTYYFRLDRHSAPMELEAMEAVRRRLFQACPVLRHLLPETIFIDPAAPRDDSLLEALSALRASCGERRLGIQYYDLAAIARHLALDDLELGIHAEEGSFWYDRLLASIAPHESGRWKLGTNPDPPELELFRGFVFPLLTLTKEDMAGRAAAGGFADLLELTWFCHTPDRKGRPCGFCAPCRLAIRQGLARRVPAVNRLKLRLAWPAIKMLTRLRVRHRARTLLKRLSGRNGDAHA
jgi:7-cyano-7-deazaguanine synthase in queuosine biosynthesis